ncbi:T9SS type A sorting domain-containing protein [Flavobacterium sp. ARAG 55.4]|uniref:T9SS type A sorting domain-containing protein n=1 Tax=Flavobacterium sp. ARAG 55.4 TaxID=3451357 RepID=UPI003F4839B1
MKNIILLLLLSITTSSISQIYFSPNANMYVKNEVLFVNQNVNLDTGSNLYLRSNGQLVQGTNATSANSGEGVVSVYQEGTADNFDYNYWCSPVGTASSVSGNGNFGISMLQQPQTAVNSNPATILNSDLDGISNPLSISARWIYKLVNASGYSQWTLVGSLSSLAPGEGFTMKGTSGTDATDPEGTGIVNNPGSAQRYDFRGKPNDGTITINLGANNSTLTGNPYPSSLHLNAFLLDPGNTATGGIAYFWEQDKTVNSHYLADYRGGYGAYSPISLASNGVYVPATFNSYNPDGSLNTVGLSSGLSIERKYSPIGQGFIIYASANGTATFKNAHREFYRESNALSQFEKQTVKADKTAVEENSGNEVTEVSHFKLNTIINNQFTRQLALAFVPEATDGADRGIDALHLDEALPNDVTFLIANNSYIIQGIPFDNTKKVPLRVKAAVPTTLKFYVPEVVNFDSSQQIFLYDTLDSSYHDIKNDSYQITVAAGVYSERFKIAFKDENILAEENKNTPKIIIVQDNKNRIIKAYNPENITVESFILYDMLGRTVISKKDLPLRQEYSFSTGNLHNGIYIAKLITADKREIKQKVILKN